MPSETPLTAPIVTICEDSDALAVMAADLVIEVARDAIARRGRFNFVLSGGSTPEKTYTLLSQPERVSAIDWMHTFLFFSDERFVSETDEHSNYAMVRKTLLARGAIPYANIFPIPTNVSSAAEAAAAYSKIIFDYFSLSDHNTPPRFDLIFLGLGSDGHTVSLFPYDDALYVTNEWVTWAKPGVCPPPVDRITLTYPVLNVARKVVFLVAGQNKAVALHDILEGQAPREDRPAAGVQSVDGTITWLVDKDAARLLSKRH